VKFIYTFASHSLNISLLTNMKCVVIDIMWDSIAYLLLWNSCLIIIIIITDLYSAFRSEDTEALDHVACDHIGIFSCIAGCSQQSLQYRWLMSGCLSVCRQAFFEITTPTVFLRFSRNLARMVCVPMPKVEQVFDIVILKFLAKKVNYKFRLRPSLWNNRWRAIWPSRSL